MENDDLAPGCFACDQQAADTPQAREAVMDTGHWRVTHAFNSTLSGRLVLLPVRHVTSFTELPPEEADELGGLVLRLSTALQAVTGCVKSYLMQLSEAEGYSHLRFPQVPRLRDLPANARGPQVFTYLTANDQQWLPAAEGDSLGLAIHAELENRPSVMVSPG